ncbi:probable polyamine transporter At3g19553 [Brachypodium distachyon]|uniref:probable polyamine transporter At3g19553 n=1 Tax=Brachypodium distachyon TaxID=15368 RepID=UPI0005300592|nr:probable polyamine transporter At3g19553 [Brachypodium distachyon]|eukprot:XP_010230148.1 probable polyamine transporter At3g19553 [Brachypodium distachyon]
MASEVERPGTTFTVVLVSVVCMASLGYLLPLMAATGAIDGPPAAEDWGNGFFADAAGCAYSDLTRSAVFGTPWASITVTGAIALGMSFSFWSLELSTASIGMLLELAAFLWLRVKRPVMPRPDHVPLGTAGAVGVPGAHHGHHRRCTTVYVTSAAFTVLGVVVYCLVWRAFCKARGCITLIGQHRGRQGRSYVERSPGSKNNFSANYT